MEGGGDKVAATMFNKYSKELATQNQVFEQLKGQLESLSNQKISEEKRKLSLAEAVQSLKDRLTNHTPREDNHSLEFAEQSLLSQLDLEKTELESLQKEKTEVSELLVQSVQDLAQLEAKNQTLEARLSAVTKEIETIFKSIKQLQVDASYKKELYEKEIKRLTDESAEMSKTSTQVSTEIEVLIETQNNLENHLSIVKNEMISLANQLAKRNEQGHLKSESRDDVTAAPKGEVTIVFADVEDSVQMWETDPTTMIISLEIFNKILRDKLKITSGYEVKSEGDFFMSAFHSPLGSHLYFFFFFFFSLCWLTWRSHRRGALVPLCAGSAVGCAVARAAAGDGAVL
jgi:hypothetical protein